MPCELTNCITKKRNEDINSSFLSEMGYLFKIIKDKGQTGD